MHSSVSLEPYSHSSFCVRHLFIISTSHRQQKYGFNCVFYYFRNSLLFECQFVSSVVFVTADRKLSNRINDLLFIKYEQKANVKNRLRLDGVFYKHILYFLDSATAYFNSVRKTKSCASRWASTKFKELLC